MSPRKRISPRWVFHTGRAGVARRIIRGWQSDPDETLALLDTFLTSAPHGFAFLDRDFRYLRLNAAMAAIDGIPLADHLGRRIGELLPDLSSAIQPLLARVLATGEPVVDHEISYKGGATPRCWLTSYHPVHALDRRILGVGFMVVDTTEHRRTEAALRTARDQLAIVLQGVAECITIQDRTGAIIFANDAAAQSVGFPSVEALLQTSRQELFDRFELLDEAGQPISPDQLPDWLALQGVERPEMQLCYRIRATGEERWSTWRATPVFDEHGKVQFAINMFQDITERKRAEAAQRRTQDELERRVIQRTGELARANDALRAEIAERKRTEAALRESEERLRAIVANVPIMFSAMDRDGIFTLMEGKGLKSLGLRPEQVVGRPVFDVYRDYPEMLGCVRRALAGESVHAVVELSGRVFEKWLSPLYDEHNQITSLIGVAIDITERRRLEVQLLQAQKMESVGRLAGGVAHDFNNLLTAIISYADLALLSLSPHSPAQGDLEEILKAAQRATGLTGQLLAFARKQVIAPQVLDLNQLIVELEKLLRRLISEDIELVILPGADLWHVKVDPNQIEQVLVNLAVNARDAMPHGGVLTIATANVVVGAEEPRRQPGLTAGEYVLLTVSDSGRGIDPDVQAHLFEPFFTTKASGQGTGLGLATCYGIVKQHGGSIYVGSNPGEGTTVSIYLPRVDAVAEAPSDQDETAEVLRGSETVLLVEDAQSVRALAARVLRDRGYTVLEATNGEDALRLVQEYAKTHIDLLLTDIVMPQMGGVMLAERLTAMRPGIKVVFMSGYTDNVMIQQGWLGPGLGFLEKPFSPSMLARKVRELLDTP